jgi:transposase
MLKDDRVIKSYSENFKLKVLSEVESGRLNKKEASHHFNVSEASINKWIKKYGKFSLLNKRIRIETVDERDRIKILEEENRRLKEALANKELKLLVSDAILEVVREQLGYKSVEELKKKYGTK